MKHFRILEVRESKKYYTIQYSKTLFFGLHYWKNFNSKRYNKYEEALNDVKSVLKKEDYENQTHSFHYIDAHKIFKSKPKELKPVKNMTVRYKR